VAAVGALPADAAGAAFGSEPLVAGPAPSEEPVAPSGVPVEPSDVPDSFGAEAAAAGEELARASFFAQPLPLKTMAGALSALRIAAPQTSHVSGPDPWIEWMTSTERPHPVQRYS
jgi:hypothetical protein